MLYLQIDIEFWFLATDYSEVGIQSSKIHCQNRIIGGMYRISVIRWQGVVCYKGLDS